jgi:hypothetical protein
VYFSHPDRYHDLPEAERERLRAWVSDNVTPRNVTLSAGSYQLKAIPERFFRERGDYDPYVSNADIKGALLAAGYEPTWSDPIDMGVRVGPRPGSDWAAKPNGPRVLGPSLFYAWRRLPGDPPPVCKETNNDERNNRSIRRGVDRGPRAGANDHRPCRTEPPAGEGNGRRPRGAGGPLQVLRRGQARHVHASNGPHLTLYVWQVRGKAAAEVLERTVPYMMSDIRRDVEYILERTRPAQSYDGDVLVLFDRLESKHASRLRSETAV